MPHISRACGQVYLKTTHKEMANYNSILKSKKYLQKTVNCKHSLGIRMDILKMVFPGISDYEGEDLPSWERIRLLGQY